MILATLQSQSECSLDARKSATEKLGESFDEHGLRLRLRLPASMVMGLARRLGDLSRGAATLERVESASE